ncbi:hypothetical protein FJ365_01910 [Candidatus Dependentiae bacterium]|nr:hypothetical protein [Candidatus Dependentiae bacterium]
MNLKYLTSCAFVLYLFVSVSSLDAMKRSRREFENTAEEQTAPAASAASTSVDPADASTATASASATDDTSPESLAVDCAICQETFTEITDCRMLPCKHRFCISCLEGVEQACNVEKPPCPACRAPFIRSTRWEPPVEPAVDPHAEFVRLLAQLRQSMLNTIEAVSGGPQPPLSGVLEEEEQQELFFAYNTRPINATMNSRLANLDGRTLLTYACENADFALAKFLVRTAGADVSWGDRRRRTPSAILNSMPQNDAVRAIKRIIMIPAPASRRSAPPAPDFSSECAIQ